MYIIRGIPICLIFRVYLKKKNLSNAWLKTIMLTDITYYLILLCTAMYLHYIIVKRSRVDGRFRFEMSCYILYVCSSLLIIYYFSSVVFEQYLHTYTLMLLTYVPVYYTVSAICACIYNNSERSENVNDTNDWI